MSKTFKLFFGIIVLISIIASTGCGKDKVEDTPPVVNNNYVMFDGAKYELSQGIIENYGEYNAGSSFNTDLTLISGYTVYESNGEIDSLYGTGNYIYFELFSSQGEKLDIGDYIYDATESGDVKTFDYAETAINFNMTTEDGTIKEIKGGKVSILSNGSEYEINFTGTDEDNKAVSAYYKGSLKYYDYSAKSANKKKHFNK